MMRGQQKCIVLVTNKNEQDIIVAPDFFKQSFKEIGVSHGSDIILHEIKNLDMYDDADEGGEEEHEEMEAEQEENQVDGEETPVAVATQDQPEHEEKKASEVLFEGDNDSKTAENNEIKQ